MLLEARDITAAYGKVAVLHEVSVAVGDGECIAILGPNNAGKSTLLRVISGLMTPRAGTIMLDGADITGDSPRRRVGRGLVQVPEGRHVFADLTVEENLLVGGLRLASRRVRRDRLAHVYDTFPALRAMRARQAGTLSGGEQQLMVIARGLMAEPRILFLDEPSLGLSPVAIDQTLGVLRAIRERGMTMAIVEQNVQFCFELCSRGYVLRQGQVAIAGGIEELSPDELRRAYFG